MTIPCRRDNYGGLRQGPVEYLVVHYTAGDGDRARDNGIYFQNNPVGASAHWFVDEEEAILSVPEDHVAWHCGGAVYRHPHCRNGNSLSVELCSKKDAAGRYFIPAKTLERGAAVIRDLMARYDVPLDRVLRHYDVTGKQCPAPLVEAGPWKEFLELVQRYDALEEIPRWARETVEKLTARQILQGDGKGLDLSRDMLRLLVILDRSGVFS